MPGDDLKQYINSKEDFYGALGVESTATEAEIRRAYRQTARKYHPDKVGAHNKAALDKFHELQIAYDVLSDATVKELYDNARRAREEQKARQTAFDGRRKAMIDELEARETGSNKRKRDEADQEAQLERELQRLAEDGKRRRQAREEQLRQEFLVAEEAERKPVAEEEASSLDDIDRSIALRYKKDDKTARVDQARLETLFARFGPVEAVVLKEKRRKPPGEKHKVDYWTGIIVFKSIVAAHAAVSDFPTLQESESDLRLLESVGWAGGQEPEAVPKISVPATTEPRLTIPPASQSAKNPKFSFNAAKQPTQAAGSVTGGRHGLDDNLMMRLKNAEKRRLESQRQQTTTSGTEV